MSQIELRKVSKNEALTKDQILREISKTTGYQKYAVNDILDCFVAIFAREVLTTGTFDYHGLPVVERHVKDVKGNDFKTKERVTYGKTCYLKATVPPGIAKKHRDIFKTNKKK